MEYKKFPSVQVKHSQQLVDIEATFKMETITTVIDEIQLEEKNYCKFCYIGLDEDNKSVSVHKKTDGDVDVAQITQVFLPELLEEQNEDTSENICVDCFENIDDLYKCKLLILEEIENKKARNMMESDRSSKTGKKMASEETSTTSESCPMIKKSV